MMNKNFLTTLFLSVCIATQAQFTFNRDRLDEIRWSPRPEEVKGIAEFKIDLNGDWKFNTSPDENFWNQAHPGGWKNIKVPGEWVMQGYNVESGKAAGYQRNFTMPEDWSGKRVKLRCEGVYSECEIWVNGMKAGSHIGGFTQFEIDITDKVRIGDNNIALAVKSESLADSLSSGSQYAVHPLGGISRPIYLLALPEVNLASYHVNTVFDANYEDAVLNAELSIVNESGKNKSAALRFELKDANGKTVAVTGEDRLNVKLSAGSKTKLTTALNVETPAKWDPEHPNLYYLHCSVLVNGKKEETLVRRFGFRQIEVRGNQVFVNNMPVKLRGVCRHEVHPLWGRSLDGDIWYEDVKLFKEGNVNYIRTSHYPPNEKLLEACDELGMFVEVEGPFCWAHNTPLEEDRYFDGIIRPLAEMVESYRSHPSVLHWSVANESNKFDEWFKQSADVMKEIDPTRPRIFSQWGAKADGGYLELDNNHYPGPGGPAKYANHDRPIIFDEYCHLNAYNRFELMTDPGVRDFWGDILHNMWEKMYHSKGVLGGAIWAGIDDSFFLPSGHVVGYGTWGPIDGWRRKKPEFWHMKKTYSPVKIELKQGQKDDKVKLVVENRYLFSNLNECRIKWKNAGKKGEVTADIAPGKRAEVELPLKYAAIEHLSIDIYRGDETPVDQYAYDFSLPEISLPAVEPGKFTWSKRGTAQIGKSDDLSVEINGKQLLIRDARGNEIINGWPVLMLVPLNSAGGTQMTKEVHDYQLFSPAAKNRSINRIEVSENNDKVGITVVESYEKASGTMQIEVSATGKIKVSYDYTMLKNDLFRQWGINLQLTENFDRLSWERKGFWSVYPEDHIGRLKGTAKLFYNDERCGLAGPQKKPDWTYNMDQTKYGSNDFRSTKRNVFKASLKSDDNAVSLLSDGTQHIRCWLENDRINMFVINYDNLGAERFLRNNHAPIYDIPLTRGQKLEGVVHFQLK